MSRERRVAFRKVAGIGAALAALALCACGRVGPLDLPPGVTVDQAPNSKRTLGPDGKEAQPPPRKPLPIDWLLN